MAEVDYKDMGQWGDHKKTRASGVITKRQGPVGRLQKDKGQ